MKLKLHPIFNIFIVLILLAISFALTIFLFSTILDRLLLWQFDGALINVTLRLLLTLFIFSVLWGLAKGVLPKYLIWILGISYSLVILFVILFKSASVSGINLNPLSLINDLLFISFYPIMNFICFIPIGAFFKFAVRCFQPRLTYFYGFFISFILEIIQFVFKLGVADINDIITNGCGFALGVLFISIMSKHEPFKKILNINQ